MRISLANFFGKRVHFVGIGGTGMSGLARIMSTYSIEVSGSDMKESSVLTGLRAIGAKVSSNHDSKNVEGADFLVFSSAISESNPEMKRARELKIPILSRAQALSALMSESTAVAVAGTHGKTTTTSMLTVAAQSCGEDPSFAIGGTLSASGSNAHRGTGDFFIAEADESDGSFVEYQPYGAVITNIEHDHVDYFKTPESVMEAFESFVGTIASDGFLVYCADDAGSQALGNSVKNIRKISYGAHADSDLRIDSIELLPQGSKARALWNGKSIGTLDL
ncbi:MAG: Mur ligase domain-containing protein, partial [Actinobacteria bacterium]|nr:Mur ligase domain-containing protein [Actinomycetota bacterium]